MESLAEAGVLPNALLIHERSELRATQVGNNTLRCVPRPVDNMVALRRAHHGNGFRSDGPLGSSHSEEVLVQVQLLAQF